MGICPGGLGRLKEGPPSTICLENGPAAKCGRVRVRVGLLQMPGRAFLAERLPRAKVIMAVGACELSPVRLFRDPVDCSPSGSAVHGIFQARILEWVAISFLTGSSDPGIEPWSPTLQADALPSEPPGKSSLTVSGLEFYLKFKHLATQTHFLLFYVPVHYLKYCRYFPNVLFTAAFTSMFFRL